MTGFGYPPNGQGFEVDPWLQWREDADAELAERFARDDRLADYTPADGDRRHQPPKSERPKR